MATKNPPPPTYAAVIIEDPVTKRKAFNPIWIEWFLSLSTNSASNHNSLSGLQGGTSGQYYHSTQAQSGLFNSTPVIVTGTSYTVDSSGNTGDAVIHCTGASATTLTFNDQSVGRFFLVSVPTTGGSTVVANAAYIITYPSGTLTKGTGIIGTGQHWAWLRGFPAQSGLLLVAAG